MRDDLDFSRPLVCDVAVAGAGLSGLVAGAILARNGRRVIVVDRPGLVGGRGGSTPHRGYWLDGGHRDGTDVGDLQVGWRYGQLAEAEAGNRDAALAHWRRLLARLPKDAPIRAALAKRIEMLKMKKQ